MGAQRVQVTADADDEQAAGALLDKQRGYIAHSIFQAGTGYTGYQYSTFWQGGNQRAAGGGGPQVR
ncbi:MAG: hypothetical protein Kow00124_32100 [Anaerolineae bacterium]